MNTVTASLGDLVDKTLEEIQSPTEQGKTVSRAASLTAAQTTFTLTGFSASVSDILEFGSELMLVTAKTDDPDPTYTVSRGYYQTTAVAHSSNQVGTVNPQWNRKRVAGAVRRAFPRLEAFDVVLLESAVISPAQSAESEFRLILAMPEETRDVWMVRNDLNELDNWEFLDDLPTADYPTGKAVRLPRMAQTTDDFNVVYRIPYRWSTHPAEPDEAATISLPEGAEDLPAAYAAAWLVGAREVSRQEIDRAMEWNTNEPTRNGTSIRFMQAKWADFYRMLDEVRRLDPPLNRRPFWRRRGGGYG